MRYDDIIEYPELNGQYLCKIDEDGNKSYAIIEWWNGMWVMDSFDDPENIVVFHFTYLPPIINP